MRPFARRLIPSSVMVIYWLGSIASAAYARSPAKSDVVVSTMTLGTLSFRGNTAISSKELLSSVPLKPGAPYDPNQVRFTQGALESVYRDRGFADVQIA